MAQQVKNPTCIHEDANCIPRLAQRVRDLALLWLWCRFRCGWDLAWLWLCCRQAAAALIHPLAWDLPYATSEDLKEEKKIKK